MDDINASPTWLRLAMQAKHKKVCRDGWLDFYCPESWQDLRTIPLITSHYHAMGIQTMYSVALLTCFPYHFLSSLSIANLSSMSSNVRPWRSIGKKTWQKLLSKQMSKSQKTTSSKYVHEKLGPFLGHPSPIWMSIFKHSMLFHGVSIEVISGLPANSSRVLAIPLALLQRSVFDMRYKGHSEATMKKGIGGSWGSRPVESLGCKQSLRYSLSECPVQHWSRLEPLQLWFLPLDTHMNRHHSMLHLQHN